MADRKDLLPCPFCDGEAVYETQIVVFHSQGRLRCNGCNLTTAWNFEIEKVYEHWNSRIRVKCIHELVKEHNENITADF